MKGNYNLWTISPHQSTSVHIIKHMLQWETITTKLQTQEFKNSNHQLYPGPLPVHFMSINIDLILYNNTRETTFCTTI